MIIEVRYGAEGIRDLDLFLTRVDIELICVNAKQAQVGRHAFGGFGNGRHPPGLSFGG